MIENPKILFLAGTGDAKNLYEYIQPFIISQNMDLLVSVVSENAAKEYSLKKIPVRSGAMNTDQMKNLINDKKISVIIDATHPFAAEVSQNAMIAAEESFKRYIRYERPDFIPENIFLAGDHKEAVQLVMVLQKKMNQNITVMLSTGAKSLEFYSQQFSGFSSIKLVARLLPSVENLELCARCNIPQSDIIAMQGPFSKELNREIFLKYNVDVLISKESGSAGSTEEKILAAGELGIKTILINRPEIKYKNICRSFEEVKNKLLEIL